MVEVMNTSGTVDRASEGRGHPWDSDRAAGGRVHPWDSGQGWWEMWTHPGTVNSAGGVPGHALGQ